MSILKEKFVKIAVDLSCQ